MEILAKSSKAVLAASLAGLLFFAAGSLLPQFVLAHLASVALRWAGLLLLVYAGARRRSLTYWIFFAMLLGLEVGLDWPRVAEHLRILSDIFLRVIKVIIAPLLFSVIVVGSELPSSEG